MKLLEVFAFVIALSAGSPVDLVPGDNSHYVEGISRYIWMPDGEGDPHLVDLQEPVDHQLLNSRNGANNLYLLFTRRNPTNAQILINGNSNSVWNSNYNGNRPLKVIVHGWNSNQNSLVNPYVRDAFLAVSDVNVIVVDWHALANSNYITAASGVPGVGQFIGNFINWLFSVAGGNWNNVHLVGFSLGAHVVGNAGRTVGSLPARITGLDPAGPLWQTSSNALRASDGRYVEAIHTEGSALGIYSAIGDTNFYPNGGRHPMPGCSTTSCSHSLAYEYFASSIYTNHFVGTACNNLNQVQNNQCSGATLNMGNSILSKTGNGIYRLTTGSSWPY